MTTGPANPTPETAAENARRIAAAEITAGLGPWVNADSLTVFRGAVYQAIIFGLTVGQAEAVFMNAGIAASRNAHMGGGPQ